MRIQQVIAPTRRSSQRRALLIGIRYKDVEGCSELSATHDGVDKFLDLLVRELSRSLNLFCESALTILHYYIVY